MIRERVAEKEQKELYFTQKFRLFKILRAWKNQVLFNKMQKEKDKEK